MIAPGQKPVNNDTYERLAVLSTEMQRELMHREWTEDQFERIDRAVELRGQLWDAIAAYRDHWSR